MAATNEKQELAHRLGTAWALMRQGKMQEALTAFSDILAAHPTLIDGLYGMGLAQAISKQYEPATASFQKCRDMAARELELHPGTDRYQMLDRMCGQRLTELKMLSAGQ
jgi:Flp pilus assembly protein TadD